MNEVTIVTHSGRFHTDDVFAVAALYIFLEHSDFPAWRNKAIKVIRTRKEEDFKKGTFVVDVGGKYDEENNWFDHHQIGGVGARPNGVPYAAFGLVWKKFGEHICGSKIAAEFVDKKLVQSIDAYDNGFQLATPRIPNAEPYLLDDFIFSFHPTWKESRGAFDATFQELVGIARELLKREIKFARAKEEAIAGVNNAYATAEDKRIIVLDQHMPWKEVLVQYKEPLFVVYPVPEENTWHVRTVTSSSERRDFKNRKDFPASWAGKRDAELAKVSGVPDALFCHIKLFLAVARSREGALMLAKKALQA